MLERVGPGRDVQKLRQIRAALKGQLRLVGPSREGVGRGAVLVSVVERGQDRPADVEAGVGAMEVGSQETPQVVGLHPGVHGQVSRGRAFLCFDMPHTPGLRAAARGRTSSSRPMCSGADQAGWYVEGTIKRRPHTQRVEGNASAPVFIRSIGPTP